MRKLGSYDVAVIGGGHAGIEAAIAAARLGAKTALFTLSLDAIGNLPCNPSIGGTAKGHLVREIDALGGCMGIAADATLIQGRMLNKGKGAAVHSLRSQADRAQYHLFTKRMLEEVDNLEIKQVEISEIVVKIIENKKVVSGLKTTLHAEYDVKTVILATGTYLNGRIFIGDANYPSGPDGVAAACALSDNLRALGLELVRFKTGTPARVHRKSIDLDVLEKQPGDEEIIPFSFLTQKKLENKADCYIAYTNEKTHEVINRNMHRSPLYSGVIEGVGPRYCPSIEDKVVRFADKDRHQIFVEPCGLGTDEMYLQGMSTSLPEDVQNEMYRTVKGFENLQVMRPAYAIEYDCINPLTLKPTLETMMVEGLYGAGQFNGSSGYEEAAGQGLLAGINATRYIQGKEEIILTRQQSYIGTLVDDLVTKGVSDPYRMMTSRSEYRLYLRQDNADERLTPLGREIGLVDDYRWNYYIKKQDAINNELNRLKKVGLSPEKVNPILNAKECKMLKSGITAYDLMKRPEIEYRDIVGIIGKGENITPEIINRIETEIKYEGYIKRQLIQIESIRKQESTLIPQEFDYSSLLSLRLEAREKLAKIRPHSLGQAARIPGVSPSDISQLSLALALYRNRKE